MNGDICEQNGHVRLDPNKMNDARLLLKGMSRNEFSTLSGLALRTVNRLFDGKLVRIGSALKALKFLGITGLKGMLLEADAASDSNSELGEWQVEKALSPWITASNGLQYR